MSPLLPCPALRQLNWGVDYSAGTTTAMIIPPPYDYTCEDTIQVGAVQCSVLRVMRGWVGL